MSESILDYSNMADEYKKNKQQKGKRKRETEENTNIYENFILNYMLLICTSLWLTHSHISHISTVAKASAQWMTH